MNTSGKTILVVEDDDDSRTLLCRMLEGLGHTPVAFASGVEALEGIEGKSFDVALLDIMMPEMNGFELLEAIKKKPEYKDMPVVMVTAKDKDDEILEGYNLGAQYYITKPYTSKQIDYGIRIVLE